MALADDEVLPQCMRRTPPFGPALGLPALWSCLLLVCGAAAAAEPGVAVVVLPPEFVAESGDKATAAAELACDQLCRELAKDPLLRIVDRAQLDRILRERGLSASAPATIVSYDAMIRLEIDTVRPVPMICLRVVDLSNGNIVVESQHPWSVPVGDDVVGKMLQQCQGKLQGLTQPRTGLLRARLLEVENATKSARMEPLAARLRETFDNALRRSKGILLVHHLEAQTAKEEALLLTMGLSQLPGGRQFVPQSDATVELRIREMDGVGKSFDETQVEVGWRIRKGRQYSGDWAVAAATVKEFDSLLKTAWAKCAPAISQAAPGAAGDYLDEMALRRKQAQAELDAAPKGLDLPKDQARQRLAHVAAAAKLDPTWEEAAYRMVYATMLDYGDPACYRAGIREAWRYIDRFRSDRKHRIDVAHRAMFWAQSGFVRLRGFEEAETLDADGRLALDALKQIVDAMVAGPPQELPGLLPEAMHIVYRGMAQTDVPVSDRRQWLAGVVQRCGRKVSPATQSTNTHVGTEQDATTRFRMHAARMLVEEGDPKAARPYVEDLITLIAIAKADAGSYIVEQARLCAEKMNDADLKAKLGAAVGGLASPLSIRWPQFGPWQDSPVGKRPRVNVQTMQYDKFSGVSPLAACGGRMYCIIPGEGPKDKPQAGFIELDKQGRPAGKITLLAKQPDAEGLRAVLSTAICKGRLYLGTQGGGLLEYDADKADWRTFGPKQGLPDWNVYTLLALDDGTLFCQGGGTGEQGYLCLVNPATSEVKLLRRLTHPKGRNPLVDTGLFPVWKTGDRIVGFIGGDSLFTLPKFGADEPACKRWPSERASGGYYSSLPDGMAVITRRRFLLCRDAFREIDDDGKVLRAWATILRVKLTNGPDALPGHEIIIPSDAPDLDRDYRHIAHDSSHAFFLSDQIVCFDPASDTWYGPLETEPWTSGPGKAVPGQDGIWFSSDRNLIYLDAADFIAAAKKAGRAITSEEFRRKREEFIRSSPPMEQAKWAMSARQWDKARDLCSGVLEKAPRNVEAMLAMGLLHEPCCLNQPDKAMEYYGKLAAIEGNSSAAFTGLVHQYRLHIEAKRHAEALRVGKLMQERFPRNTSSETISRYNRWLEEQVKGGPK